MSAAPLAASAFWPNATVFFTGASGTVGMAVLSKLLAGDIGRPAKIYCMLRDKKTSSTVNTAVKNSNQTGRLPDLLADVLFDPLREKMGEKAFNELANKIIVEVTGDIVADGFGMSDASRKEIVKNATVVINCAADVNFTRPLSELWKTNTVGSMNVLQMAEEIYKDHPQKFDCFVHVSTSYVNSHLVLSPPEGYPVGSPIEEKLYPAAYDVTDFVSPNVDLNNPALLAAAERFPNMYAFSKHMVEHAIKEKRQTAMPIAIVRPAIVGASWAEPQPGWLGSSQGCTSMMLACGLGLMKGVPMDSKLIFDMVPLDTVIDAILATPVCYSKLHCEKGSVAVVQAGTSTTHPLVILTVFKNILAYFQDHPSKTKQVRRPDFVLDVSIQDFANEMAWQKRIATWVSYLPFIGKVGDKLAKATRQCEKLVDVLPKFLSREFRFHAPNLTTMRNHFEAEGVLDVYAGLDQSKMDWDHYVQRYCYGLRRFLLNEKDAVLPACGALSLKRRWNIDGSKGRPMFTYLGLTAFVCLPLLAMNWDQSVNFVTTTLSKFVSRGAPAVTDTSVA